MLASTIKLTTGASFVVLEYSVLLVLINYVVISVDFAKYLGMLQADQMRHQEKKDKVTKEYKRRVRKILETKLNAGNFIKSINIWAVSLLRYSATFLSWTKFEMEQLDRQTRKLMTMHNALHPKSNVDRLYLPRKDGGRGFLGVEDTVSIAKKNIEKVCQQ